MTHREAPISETVIGVGIDLVEVARMREVIARWGDRFCARVFREDEQRYCESRAAPWRHYAARFALKEAVGKAFGTGIGTHIGWTDVETHRTAEGAPQVRLYGRAAELAKRRGVTRLLASLAHGHDYAVAQVVLLAGERRP